MYRSQLRNLVRKRAKEICEYCRIPESFSPQPFCFEHILPKFADGKTTAENLALACQGCNAFKATRTEFADEITETKAQVFNPRKQIWSEHFAWSADFTEVFGITPTGRATIKALKLNRIGLVNLRRALYVIGNHPPTED
ncbi:MAG: HNH endonuclease [Pyrinomonadaceae bacterium]